MDVISIAGVYNNDVIAFKSTAGRMVRVKLHRMEWER
jgi:hypothetical protein